MLIMTAAGVDLEEAAGKWRAGDAAKSMRFFTRAVETYDQGLRKFSSSLDLAYNKLVWFGVVFRSPTRLTFRSAGPEFCWKLLLIPS